MRKLIIQVPCFNEEATLGRTLEALPRNVPGFERVEWLVVDDGCTDHTVEVAYRHGVDHIVRLPNNQGLARAFMAGIEASLKAGADVIINTDADNQYDAAAIPDLVRPILDGRAQIVIGARPIAQIKEFSPLKKALQYLGSAVVKTVSRTQVPDAPSGFRAIQKEAALRLCVFSSYTYTLETIIQAGRKNIPVVSVPVRVNPAARPSRLVSSKTRYVAYSILTILRIYVLYKRLRFFTVIGSLLLLPGVLIGARFLLEYFRVGGAGHVQSLILAAILILMGVIAYMAGIVADLIAANRMLLEEVRTRLLRAEVARATEQDQRADRPSDAARRVHETGAVSTSRQR